ncbi:hypothetical protein GLOTRDRAFT_128738 [Gloeophyllum trabeum ATCC 11539]|uniref:F-box domain-containing protein n=1 Tax=Gloeophyllum trabeum (strain ATCC 11539 / FP-39264 / Madison 617) TaxID=670483 RepID=S7Q7L3_GLOTA|nr:uncharacterized protein GLOTRDRAFT_128738 [Gloeophyllum trabeum ATCC 11539]EPQ55507.1 hypothetical protein GLOTRDRAFT_128738 [Gloeophyllum trabeum ATCC 11539]
MVFFPSFTPREMVHRSEELFSQIKLDDATMACVHALDNRISELEQQLVQTKRRRNSFMPVARLPMELVAKIISLAWHDCASYEPTFLVDMTHVWSHWREAALQTQYLWSLVGLKNSRHVRAMLERSRGAPLKVSGRVNSEIYPGPTKAFYTVLRKLHRVQELDIHVLLRDGKLWKPTPLGMRLRKCLFPALQSLVLSSERCDNIETHMRWISQVSLPHLQHLAVHCFSLSSYHNFLLPSLTSLSIEETRGIDVPLMIAILEDLPQLKTLKIVHSIFLPVNLALTPIIHHNQDKTRIPCLRSLTLGLTLMECSSLLAQLEFPAVTDVQITLHGFECERYCRDYMPEVFLVSDLLGPIIALCHTALPSHRRRKLTLSKSWRPGRDSREQLVYKHDDYLVWMDTRPTTSSDEGNPRMLVSVAVGQQQPLKGTLQNLQDARHVLLQSLATVNLEYLQLESGDTAEDWNLEFGHLIHVTRLWVTGADDDFLDALNADFNDSNTLTDEVSTPAADIAEDILFPSLRYLVLEEGPGSYDGDFAERLSIALRSRQRTGRIPRLSHLDIQGVEDWASQHVACLQETVDKLTLRPPADIYYKQEAVEGCEVNEEVKSSEEVWEDDPWFDENEDE